MSVASQEMEMTELVTIQPWPSVASRYVMNSKCYNSQD